MSTDVIEVVLKAFKSIETRDRALESEAFANDVDLHWPPELPYGGSTRTRPPDHPTWSQTWDPLQPTEAERDLQARVIAASDDEAVVLWRQKGVTPSGERVDTPVLGLYQVKDGKLRRGQMFYFNPSEVVRFLAATGSDHRTVI